jgi:hypothetical protein
MGYTTEFEGSFTVTPPLDPAQVAYLKAFAETRRMKRSVSIVTTPDPLRCAAGLGIGDDAGYFVGSKSPYGQDRDASVLDYNAPPAGQPGLWCRWEPSDDGATIAWNGAEKFYDYVEWLNYLVVHFLAPWGRALSGEVSYQGEDRNDRGVIVIKNGRAVAVADVITRGAR